MSHGREQLPDISAFDLGLSFEHRSLNNPEVVNIGRADAETIGDLEVRLESTAEGQQNAASVNARQTGHSNRTSANESEDSLSRRAVGGARDVANEGAENMSHDSNRNNAESAEVDSMRRLLEQAEQDKQTAQKVRLFLFMGTVG